jgi:FkbM family methyltransferase
VSTGLARATRAQVKAMARRVGVDLRRYPLPGSPADCRGRLLRHHDVDLVLDVGAAIGEYGRLLRDHGYQGRIVSCEPLATSFHLLATAAARDPRWEALELALGREAGWAELNVAGNGDSSSFLPMLDEHVDAAPESGYIGTREVQVTTVDAILAGHEAEHPFLKLDVQGFEHHVLAGARTSFDRLVGIQLEMSLVPLYDGQLLFRETYDLLVSAGFALQVVEPAFVDLDAGRVLQIDGVFFRPVTGGVS